MTQFAFRHFAECPTGPARILHVVRQLQQTEVGRLFLSNLPQHVTFIYFKGDITSRASANNLLGTISIPENTFRGPYETAQTVIHELAHLIQQVPQFDPGLKPLLEGVFGTLYRHRADRRYAWVTAPLDRIQTEETLAQEVVALVFRLGYGRNYRDRYYVPGDEGSPPHGVLRPALAPADRATFLATIRRLQAKQLSPQQLRTNLTAFEQFYARALSVGWVGESPRYRSILASERSQRAGANPHR